MSNDSKRAPLFEALERHAARKAASFHVPGHKQRPAWQDEAAQGRFAGLLPIDLTELSDTDDLHHPEGAIAKAERLAAECFGAEESRMLVGGSTAGNLAMILGLCAPGELLLVQRNVHKSIIHGLMLAGTRAVFLPPVIDAGTGLALAPSTATVRAALRRYPEAKGLVLSNPNYYGMSVSLTGTIQAAHEAGIPVLVDEAHGPHFGRLPAFPASALQAGADVVVQSAHKMLPAMTMGAWLHLQGSRVPREAIRQQLRMIQSSSPSYPIMASLDLARREIQVRPEACFEPALAAALQVRGGLAASPFNILEAVPEYFALDPLKLVLYDATGRLDGFRLLRELELRGCVAEMADDRYVLLALGAGSRPEDGQALLSALRDIADAYELCGDEKDCGSANHRLPDAKTGPYDRQMPDDEIPLPTQFNRAPIDAEPIRLEEAAGRTSGEWIIPYPPGIPALYPGETITEEAIARLVRWRKEGARIQGAADPSLRTVRTAKL